MQKNALHPTTSMVCCLPSMDMRIYFPFCIYVFYSKAEKYDFIVKREICQCTLLSPSEGFDEIKLGLPVVNDFSHVILGRSTRSSFPNVALS